MGAGTQTSVEEYLQTVYRPDCDYIDGLVEKRNVGERDHARLQGRFIVIFDKRRAEGVEATPEWRFQVGPNRFRIPDVVVTLGLPDEEILTTTPLVCIEILSPEDRFSRVQERIQDYLEFGVPAVWVADPKKHRIWIYRSGGMEEAIESVRIDGTSIEIPLSEIFD